MDVELANSVRGGDPEPVFSAECRDDESHCKAVYTGCNYSPSDCSGGFHEQQIIGSWYYCWENPAIGIYIDTPYCQLIGHEQPCVVAVMCVSLPMSGDCQPDFGSPSFPTQTGHSECQNTTGV
jgi:hypothetical protein